MIQLIRNVVNYFKGAAKKFPYAALPEGGHSSQDPTLENNIQGIMNHYSGLQPDVPFESITVIRFMSIWHPYLCKALSMYQAIANTGHKLEVSGPNVEAIANELNDLAQRFGQFSAGADGLINHLIRECGITGVPSYEDSLFPDYSGVKEPLIIPAEEVRFKVIEGSLRPFQVHKTNAAGIELNPYTYRYYAMARNGRSPFAIPPLASAIDPGAIQVSIYNHIREIVEKMTLMGLNLVEIDAPAEALEKTTAAEQSNVYQAHIKRVMKAIEESTKKGLIGHGNGIKWQHFDVNASAAGLEKIVELLERLFFTGLNTSPEWHGRNVNRSETFIAILYLVLISFVNNIRRVVKRRYEDTLRLHLNLKGISFDKVSVDFNPNEKARPNIDSLARSYDVGNVLKLLEKGLLDPTQAARELGYEEFADEEFFRESLKQNKQGALLKNRPLYPRKTLVYDSKTNLYRFQREVIHLSDTPAEHSKHAKLAKTSLEDKLKTKVDDYLKAILPYFDELQDDVKTFALQYVKDHIEEISQDSTVLKTAVVEYIKTHEIYSKIKEKESWFRKTALKIITRTMKDYKLDDDSVFGDNKPDFQFKFGEGDKTAAKFYERLDNLYFSKFIDNQDFGAQINSFINGFLERGENLFGKWSNAVEKEFNRLFGAALEGDVRLAMERIINTSVTRLRTYSHVVQLFEVSYISARIHACDNACSICSAMDGQLIPIKEAYEAVQYFISLTAEEAAEYVKNSNVSKELAEQLAAGQVKMEDMLKDGKGIIPLHVSCKCTIEGVYNENQ